MTMALLIKVPQKDLSEPPLEAQMFPDISNVLNQYGVGKRVIKIAINIRINPIGFIKIKGTNKEFTK